MKEEIIDKVYRLYYKDVYLYLYALCKNHHITEDLVSDTFYKAVLTLKGDEAHLKYWLFRVAKNLWLDSIKKKKHEPLDEKYMDKTQGPLEVLLVSERNKMLYKTILSLPDQYKEVLVMYYFNDYSLKDIASIKCVSAGSVRTLIYRARKHLKKGLEA